MFQTKVSEAYVQQVNQKSQQDTWLEEELVNVNRLIQQFKQSVTISSKQDLLNSFKYLSAICEILRNEDLDPEHYEQLQKAIKQFLLGHVKDTFKQAYKQEYITQQDLLAEVMMIPSIYGRLYLTAVVASQAIQQLQQLRNKLYNDEDYEKKLRKLGFPTQQRDLRGMIQNILQDLNIYAIGIQEPVKHIFYRQFMFESVSQYIDLELQDEEERTFQTSKDYILASNFMLENYIECNRLWCRTAYDPARTKNETIRRDRKRKYLADIISKGLIQLVNYCIYDQKRGDIIVEVITRIAQSNDAMAACTILDSIVEILPPECIAENVSKILYPISTFTSGVNTFIKISTKLQENNLITEKIYGKIVKSGTVLCQTLIETEKENGIEEVLRLINLGKKFESEVQTPWLAIWREILLMAGKVFSDDVDKMNEALEEVIQVMYKGCEGRIQELADRLTGKYVEPIKEDTKEKQSKKEKRNVESSDSQDSSSEEQNSQDYKSNDQEESIDEVEKTSIDQFQCITMTQENEKSLMQVMSAPLIYMDMTKISEYLTCPSIIILRHHLQQTENIIDIRFCEEVAINLIKRPIIKLPEEFILSRDEDSEKNEILADVLLTMADDNPYEFSQTLQCTNISLQVFNKYQQRVLNPQSHSLIVVSLFNALLRDNYVAEAIKVVDFMTPGNSYQQPVLYQEACNLEAKIIKGEVVSIFKPTFDDLYDLYCKLIISYENAISTVQQPQILLYLLNLLHNAELPSGEELRIIKRYQAACYNLMVKHQQAVCYVNLAKIYQKYVLLEEMKQCLQIAEQMNEKYGTEQSKEYYQIALEEFKQGDSEVQQESKQEQ